MNVSPVNVSYKNYIYNKNHVANNTNIPGQTTFKGNFPLEKLLNFSHKPVNIETITPEVYFVDMYGYGRNMQWAKQMTELAKNTSKLIRNKARFDDVLSNLCHETQKINNNNCYGILRYSPHGFDIMNIKQRRGIEYFDKFVDILNKHKTYYYNPKSNSEYPDATTCTISKLGTDLDAEIIIIDYGIFRDPMGTPLYGAISNLEFAKEEYEKLLQIKNPSLNQINKSCATIHWLIAQETPWKRGSDSIARLLTTSIYAAYNVKVFPPKTGISFDFEAFGSDLNEYIKKYPDLFTQRPYKIP